MESLERIRKDINKIDQEMAILYEKRMLLMRDVIEYKIKNNLPIFDEEREKIVINNNTEFIQKEELKDYYKDFIQFIMNQGKDIQKKILEQK